MPAPALAPDHLGQAVGALAEALAARIALRRTRLRRAGVHKAGRRAVHAAGHLARQRLHRVRQLDDLRAQIVWFRVW